MKELKHEANLIPPEPPVFYADCGHRTQFEQDEYLMKDGSWVCPACMKENPEECEDYSRRLAGYRVICGRDVPYYRLG